MDSKMKPSEFFEKYWQMKAKELNVTPPRKLTKAEAYFMDNAAEEGAQGVFLLPKRGRPMQIDMLSLKAEMALKKALEYPLTPDECWPEPPNYLNKYRISAIIPFCSCDLMFFQKCVGNLLALGIECIVVTYSHLYAGEPENIDVLEKCNKMFSWHPLFKMIRLTWTPGKPSIFWEANARHIGALSSNVTCDYTLFIDIDEIVDIPAFRAWLDKGQYKKYRAIKLNFYSYDRESTIICKKWFALEKGLKLEARLQFFNNSDKWNRLAAKLGLNPFFKIYRGKPLIHHFTSVRSKIYRGKPLIHHFTSVRSKKD